MPRKEANCNWTGPPNASGSYSFDAAQLHVLMDIRGELQRLNTLLHCPNFVEIPQILRTIRRTTTKRTPRKPRA